MPAAAIATIVIALLLIAAVAYYLIRVILILHEAVDTLGKVTFGVRAIAYRAVPIDPVLRGVNADLTAVAGALEGLLPAAADTTKEPV